jgi:hypothetical protein
MEDRGRPKKLIACAYCGDRLGSLESREHQPLCRDKWGDETLAERLVGVDRVNREIRGDAASAAENPVSVKASKPVGLVSHASDLGGPMYIKGDYDQGSSEAENVSQVGGRPRKR